MMLQSVKGGVIDNAEAGDSQAQYINVSPVPISKIAGGERNTVPAMNTDWMERIENPIDIL